jgi:hypothetical protein
MSSLLQRLRGKFIEARRRSQARQLRHDAIAAFAAEMAGTEFDLDGELEALAVEHLLDACDRE